MRGRNRFGTSVEVLHEGGPGRDAAAQGSAHDPGHDTTLDDRERTPGGTVTEASGVPIRALQTPRLVLEPQTAAHAEEMYTVLTDPAIYEFENEPPASVDALRARYRKLESGRSPDGTQLWLNWVVRLRGDGNAIGYVQATVLADAQALIAYEFGSAWWGRGLAHEATDAAVRELHDTFGVATVGAVFKRANDRSRKLLNRLGMRETNAGEFPRDLAEPDEVAAAMNLGTPGRTSEPCGMY
jgi:RimJ/RimL family protein N-acetyltransferase